MPDETLAAIQTPRAVLLLDPLNIFQWIDIALTDDVAGVSDELHTQVHRAKEWGLEGRPLRSQILTPRDTPRTSSDPARSSFD